MFIKIFIKGYDKIEFINLDTNTNNIILKKSVILLNVNVNMTLSLVSSFIFPFPLFYQSSISMTKLR
jgi:hypothetical protein